MRKGFIGALALAVAVIGYGSAAFAWGGSHTPAGHVGICHHTGSSQAHEWVFITPDANGVLDGHGKPTHQFQEDIIPAFTLVRQGQTVNFPGLNLDERIGVNLEPNPNGPFTGAEILANNCQAPTGGTTTTTPGGTTTITVPGTTSVTTVTVTTPGGTTTIKAKLPRPVKGTRPPKTARAPFTR